MLITDILILKRNFSLFISALIKRSKRSKGHLSRADSCPHTVSNLDSSPPPRSPQHPAVSTHLLHQTLTISRHAHCQALLQPAVLAAVAAGAVDQAVLLAGAGVGCIALLTPPEEALHGERGGTENTSGYRTNRWIGSCLHSVLVLTEFRPD